METTPARQQVQHSDKKRSGFRDTTFALRYIHLRAAPSRVKAVAIHSAFRYRDRCRALIKHTQHL